MFPLTCGLSLSHLFHRSPADITKEACKTISEKLDKVALDDSTNGSLLNESETPHRAPEGVADFDKENWNDPFQVSNYAMDIFNYMKNRQVRGSLFVLL